MDRFVQPELLDELPARDPRAMRSRRDLRRLNTWMRHHEMMARALQATANGEVSHQLVELGAGDGHFLLNVARRLNGRWHNADATLVDRLDTFDVRTCARFQALDWRVNAEVADAVEWLARSPARIAGTVVANLFLHQYAMTTLRELLRRAAESARVFIAVEPRRGIWPLFCSRFVGLIGCGSVTRHDAPASVRAGFAGGELSALWPDRDWFLTERHAGLFSHLFIAQRKG